MDQGVEYIKRIIGLPGDTIEVSNGMVYINGEPYEEDYIAEEPTYEFGSRNRTRRRILRFGG